MLVMRRRSGQDIEVTGPARFKILDAVGAVKIGVEAAPSVHIIRSELVDRPIPAEAACDGEWDEDEPELGGEGVQ